MGNCRAANYFFLIVYDFFLENDPSVFNFQFFPQNTALQKILQKIQLQIIVFVSKRFTSCIFQVSPRSHHRGQTINERETVKI